jgi:hypothetical protein
VLVSEARREPALKQMGSGGVHFGGFSR